MPLLKVTASWPVLDRDAFLKAYQASVDEAVKKAARKFLLAAIPLIPVFTGFAAGAFGNLEDVIGRVQAGRIRTNLKSVKTAKNLQSRVYYYYPKSGSRVARNTISGRQFATKPKDIIGQGQLSRAETKSRIVFKFSVDISYFDYLDKTKWHAFAAGKAAFDAELKIQLEKLRPKLGDYIIRREIK